MRERPRRQEANGQDEHGEAGKNGEHEAALRTVNVARPGRDANGIFPDGGGKSAPRERRSSHRSW